MVILIQKNPSDEPFEGDLPLWDCCPCYHPLGHVKGPTRYHRVLGLGPPEKLAPGVPGKGVEALVVRPSSLV